MKKFNYLNSSSKCKEYKDKIKDNLFRENIICLVASFSRLKIFDIIYFNIMKKNYFFLIR